jgi:hypothetical protein
MRNRRSRNGVLEDPLLLVLEINNISVVWLERWWLKTGRRQVSRVSQSREPTFCSFLIRIRNEGKVE